MNISIILFTLNCNRPHVNTFEQAEGMKNTDLIERSAEGREKRGVFTGWHVINPVTKEKVQLWIACLLYTSRCV